MKPIQFFSENGEYSANRLMYIFGCSLILLVWAYLSIKNNQIMMESSISWIFGSLVAGKLFQKYIETQPTPKG